MLGKVKQLFINEEKFLTLSPVKVIFLAIKVHTTPCEAHLHCVFIPGTSSYSQQGYGWESKLYSLEHGHERPTDRIQTPLSFTSQCVPCAGAIRVETLEIL